MNDQQPTLKLQAITLRAARQFVGLHHRHSRPPVGGKFAVTVAVDEEIVAVGIAGQPVARLLDDGATIEITRCCTLGTPNAASMVYGALCRAAKALGYRRAVTYTLADEPGTSLRASGWRRDADVAPASWHRKNRPRREVDLFGEPITPRGPKVRWQRQL